MRQRFNRSFYIRRIFSSRTDCLYWSLTWENPSGSLQLHMCQFKSNCGHFHLKFHWNLSSSWHFQFVAQIRSTSRSRDLIDWLSVTLRWLEWPKKRRKKEEQISQPVCWLPCGSSRGKFRHKTPDGSKLSLCGAGFPATEPSHGTDCNRLPLYFNIQLQVQSVGLCKKNYVLSPEFRTHSGNRNQVNASQSADYDSEVRTAGNALELGATWRTTFNKKIDSGDVRSTNIALFAPLWSYPPHGGVLSGNSLFRPDCVTVSQALRYRHFLINSGGTSDSTEIVNLIAIFSRI